MSKVIEILNTSGVTVPVDIGGVTVYLNPGQKLENEEVNNLAEIRRFVRVKENLAEVVPSKRGKQNLNG